MPVPKDKVSAAIETKFKGKSLTKNFKDQLATNWAEKIETEEGIEEFINDREDVILAASTEGDRRATAAATKARQEAADAAAGKKTEPEPAKEPELPADTPEWAKAIMQSTKALAEKVNGFESKQQAKTLQERFESDPRVKDVPAFIRNGYIPTTEEEFETKATSLATEFKTFAETNKLSSFGKDAPPPPGTPGGSTKTDGKVDADIAAFAKAKNDAAAVKN